MFAKGSEIFLFKIKKQAYERTVDIALYNSNAIFHCSLCILFGWIGGRILFSNSSYDGFVLFVLSGSWPKTDLSPATN